MYQTRMIRTLLIIITINIRISCSVTYFKTTKIECAPDSKYFYNHSCRLKAIDRYKTVAHMSTQILKSLRNITVNMALYKLNDVNIFRPILVNVTYNVCELLDRKKFNPYTNVMMKTLSKYSNVNHTCPYTGMLITEDLYVDQLGFPWPLPASSYKLQLTFYEGYPYDPMGNVKLFVNVLNVREKNVN